MQEFVADDNGEKCLVAGIRFILSGMALLIFYVLKFRKAERVSSGDILFGLSYGLLGTAFQYAFTYIGLSNIDGAKGAIFDQLCVFIIIIISGLLMKNDRLTLLKALGCLIGLAGVFAVSTESMSFTFNLSGDGMMILASVCQSAAYFIATFTAGKFSPIKLVGLGQLFGGALLLIFGFINGGGLEKMSALGIITLISLSAISALAYALSLIPLKYFPASEVSVYNLLITVFGVVMSGIFLGENILKINYLISLILISIGILAVNYRKRPSIEGVKDGTEECNNF